MNPKVMRDRANHALRVEVLVPVELGYDVLSPSWRLHTAQKRYQRPTGICIRRRSPCQIEGRRLQIDQRHEAVFHGVPAPSRHLRDERVR